MSERAAPTATADRGADLHGAIALVTGGGRGLGEATCRRLAEAGATVIAADVDLDSARAVAERLSDEGWAADAERLDVADDIVATGAVRSILDRYGRIDALVNNAGVDVTAPFEELTNSDWDRVLGVNLRGPIMLCRVVFPAMRQHGGGHIVNVVSTAAKRAWPNASAYHTSKWGLLGFSHSLHVEGRPLGIKVTAVVAGGMRTPFLLDRFPDIDVETLQDPANVAAAIHFALSQPAETVVPELMVIPMGETSWP
jgi:NAD(P)-dependent dehydrogenase (short-subunit alcohol dehydrogenase family)